MAPNQTKIEGGSLNTSGYYVQVTMNVSSPGKQQRTGGACPLSLMVYENTHRVHYSNSSANLPCTISWFSVPAPPPPPARAASPPEWTLVNFSLNFQNRNRNRCQSHLSQLPTPCLMMIDPPSPSFTLNHHHHLLRQTCTRLSSPGLRLPRISPSRCSIRLAALEYMYSRSTPQLPSIIDQLESVQLRLP